jgi:hypothetical protein
MRFEKCTRLIDHRMCLCVLRCKNVDEWLKHVAHHLVNVDMYIKAQVVNHYELHINECR